MAQQYFIPTGAETHLEARTIWNSNASDAEVRLLNLERRLDLEPLDTGYSYDAGEAFYYAGSAYRVSAGYTLGIGEDPTTNPEKVEKIGGSLSLADITDAGTAAASDVGDFATAAQGVLASTALQTGSIDTLAELNSVVGDATLLSSAQIAAAYQPLDSVLTNTTASFTTADETKIDYITVNQAVNLDTIESDTATNNAKVSNVSTTLGYITSPTTGTITSDGTSAVISGASSSHAGLFSSADYDKLGLISVTGAVDLDAIEAANGDMLAATYDPTNVSADAFAMDNMVEGDDTKILTSGERDKLSNISVTQPVNLDDLEATVYTFTGQTVGAVQNELFYEGGQRLVLPDSTSWGFNVLLSAKQTGGTAGATGDSYMAKSFGGVKRLIGAANTSMVGNYEFTETYDAAAAGWSFDIDADTTNGSLRFQGSGEADKNINWVARVELSEN